MKPVTMIVVAAAAATTLLAAACGSAAPTAPTVAPQATASNPAPTATAAPAAPAATAPAAAKVEFPAKGKSMTLIVPWAAGGSSDVGARLVAAGLEKELGTTIQVVNKPGAASQVGLAEAAMAKPDGYNFVFMVIPPAISIYMDAERKATFDRKSFIPLAVYEVDPMALSVKGDSPYKVVKDLVDAAKANPGKIRLAGTGFGGTTHLVMLSMQRKAEVKFATVQFNGDNEGVTALLGGHVDATVVGGSGSVAQHKAGGIRVLAHSGTNVYRTLPGVPTLTQAGIPVSMAAYRGLAYPAGVPKGIVDTMATAIQKVTASAEFKEKAEKASVNTEYLGPTELSDVWTRMEADMKPLLDDLRNEPKS